MRIERMVSFAIVIILLGIVMYRGAVTGFATGYVAPAVVSAGCADYDSGFSPSAASVASSGGVDFYDTCADKGALFEAVCNNGRAEYRLVNCNYDVSAGSSCIREGLSAYCG